ncbi:hypothetical protein GCM10017559_80130 [Streptosporangium longisporum]|uniref:Phage tail tape measure protein n=1 Tax=Streptosporangium longisporum TaxID=46187 RepID=A0ABP6LCR1_9ACTN
MDLGSLAGRVGDWFGQMKDAAIGRANDLINWLRGLPGTIMGIFNNLGGMLGTIGHNMVIGLWNGFVNTWNSFMSMLGNLFSNMVNWLRSILGIASPSKVFAAIGKQLPAGLAIGIDAGEPMVAAATERMAGVASAFAVPDVAPAGAAFGAASAGGLGAAAAGVSTGGGGVTIQGDLVMQVEGVLDPSRPDAYRTLLVQLRNGLRDLDREVYA